MPRLTVRSFELHRALAALSKTAEKVGDEVLREGAYDAAGVVVPVAQQHAPRRTGTLAGNVRRLRGRRATAYVAAGSARVPYAGPIHYGWPRHNISPDPFLLDAGDERRDEIMQVYEERLAKVIEEEGLD